MGWDDAESLHGDERRWGVGAVRYIPLQGSNVHMQWPLIACAQTTMFLCVCVYGYTISSRLCVADALHLHV